MILNLKNKKFLIIPIIFAVLLTLIPTLNSNWPLSWDVYTQINYTWAYLINGITTVDPLLNAPSGKSIGYAPLFQLILLFISSITNTDFITTSRLIQPILAGLCTLTLVYISYKLFNETAGIITGVLLISSFMFTRLMLPIPETVAIIFFTLGIYLLYKSLIKNSYKYAICSGTLSLIILLVHFSTFIYYILLSIALMIVYVVLNKNIKTVQYYIWFLVPIVVIGGILSLVLITFSPNHLNTLITAINSILTNPLNLFMGQKAMGIERYIKCIGILPLIFGIIGIYYSFKNKKHVLIALWTFIAFIISNLHWIGIPVYTYRMLIYLIIPTVIIGGYGLSNIINKCDLKYKGIGSSILLIMLILTLCIGYLNITDPNTLKTSVTTSESTVQIAQPTFEEVELINWFKTENTENSSILINNLFTGTIISSANKIPIHYSFDVYATPTLHKSSIESLKNESIGYIVYDKSLVMKNNNNSTTNLTPEVKYIKGDFYPLYYYTQQLNENNFNKIQLKNTVKVFESSRFIVCKVIYT